MTFTIMTDHLVRAKAVLMLIPLHRLYFSIFLNCWLMKRVNALMDDNQSRCFLIELTLVSFVFSLLFPHTWPNYFRPNSISIQFIF